MSRMYIVNHWNDAAAYSGEQIGDRLKDSQALHFNRDGSANVNLYSEETAQAKKKTSIPLKNRILPQVVRVEKLTAQMVELCDEYKQGLHTKEDYSLLLSVISAKRARAEELLAKAVSVKAPFEQEESSEDETSAQHSPQVNSPITPEKPVPIAVNCVNKACNSALKDAMILITGAASLLALVKFFF